MEVGRPLFGPCPNYYDEVSDGKVEGSWYIRKFGRLPGLTSPLSGTIDLWEGGNIGRNGTVYPWDLANAPLYISSSDATDTVTMRLSGQRADDPTYPDIGVDRTQDVTLQGQTKVTVPGDWLHCFRAVNRSETANIAGTVYIYRDSAVTNGVPTNPAQIRAVVANGYNKTQMAVWAVPYGEVAEFIEGEINIAYSATGPSVGTAGARVAARVIRRGGTVYTLEKGVDLLTSGNSSYTDRLVFTEPVPAGGKIALSILDITEDMGFTGEFSCETKLQSKYSADYLAGISQPGF